MKRIYKYSLDTIDQQVLRLPSNSKVLSVAAQGDNIVLYVRIDDTIVRMTDCLVLIHGTGHDADDTIDSTFVGTVNLYNGTLMFHVFYKETV